MMADGMEIRFDVMLQTLCFGGQTQRGLQQAQVEEDADQTERPSVVLQRVQRDTPVWEIAKAHRADPTSVRLINQLKGDYLEEDCMLLIPVG